MNMNKKRIVVEKGRCDFCGCCVCVCPEDAILLEEAAIQINEQVCTLCQICVSVCPLGILELRNETL